MISCAPSESSNVAKDDDKDDEYFGSTESTDGTANDSSLSQTLHSAIKFEWVALNLLEEPRTNSDVLRSYPIINAVCQFCLRLHLINGFSALHASSPVLIAVVWAKTLDKLLLLYEDEH